MSQTSATTSALTQAFEDHQIDPAEFHHQQHVQVAYELLGKYDFIDASAIYAKGIRTLASNAGVPQKFNLTITYLFMSLIAERKANNDPGDVEGFMAQNADLMEKTITEKWYSKERLNSDLARQVFLMPDK